MRRLRVHQVAGYDPIKISGDTKRAILSAFFSVPASLIALATSDSVLVSNTFRYVFSPGTMFAIRFVNVEASHRGLGVFIDALNTYATSMEVAFAIDLLFYGLLIFGIITTISAIRSGSKPI